MQTEYPVCWCVVPLPHRLGQGGGQPSPSFAYRARRGILAHRSTIPYQSGRQHGQSPEQGHEARKRSLAKAISWRVVAFIVLSIITYAFTGSLKETGLIALVYNGLQIGIYFVHERIWERIGWGKPSSIDLLPSAQEVTPEELAVIVDRLRDLGYME